MRAVMQFIKGMWHMTFLNRVWTCVLTLVNLVIPLWYVGLLEAQVVLGVFFVNAVAMIALTALTGYTRLVGLGHALWLALVYYIWTRLPDFPIDTFLGLWMRILMVVNSLTLISDAINVWLYLRGNRKSWVEPGP